MSTGDFSNNVFGNSTTGSFFFQQFDTDTKNLKKVNTRRGLLAQRTFDNQNVGTSLYRTLDPNISLKPDYAFGFNGTEDLWGISPNQDSFITQGATNILRNGTKSIIQMSGQFQIDSPTVDGSDCYFIILLTPPTLANYPTGCPLNMKFTMNAWAINALLPSVGQTYASQYSIETNYMWFLNENSLNGTTPLLADEEDLVYNFTDLNWSSFVQNSDWEFYETPFAALPQLTSCLRYDWGRSRTSLIPHTQFMYRATMEIDCPFMPSENADTVLSATQFLEYS